MCCKLDLLVGVQTALLVQRKNKIYSALSPSEEAGGSRRGQWQSLCAARSWWCQNRSAGVWLEWSCSRSCPGMLCPSPTMVKWVEFHSCHFGALWAVRNWAQPGITPWIHLPFLDCFRTGRTETGLGSAEPACSEPRAGEGVPLSKVQRADGDDAVPLSGVQTGDGVHNR